MSALAEIAVAIASFVLQIIAFLGELAIKPIRFVISEKYRSEIRTGWKGRRNKQYFAIIAGTLVLLLFTTACAICFHFLVQPPPPPGTRERAEAMFRGIFLDHTDSNKKRSPSNAAEQGAAANP